MEPKLQFRGNVYSVCVGYKTQWFSCLSFITIAQEWYENYEVVYATLIYRS